MTLILFLVHRWRSWDDQLICKAKDQVILRQYWVIVKQAERISESNFRQSCVTQRRYKGITGDVDKIKKIRGIGHKFLVEIKDHSIAEASYAFV
ncbi:hypothetical protein CesoFtcFv8_014744 [Champsocephalus esox]|uniref:Uncharacterized protein n=1 Tax=Champsocephalus esox TaxID=159716 RepID=A0AAN8BPG5_9TELE|nr:hypothetical protein CesoFtcFv8_014744 [Champsocephalus esox]